jgi:hypothetical protein
MKLTERERQLVRMALRLGYAAWTDEDGPPRPTVDDFIDYMEEGGWEKHLAPVQSQGSPPADCKCGCESDGKIPQLEQELQAMMAKLAGVAFVAKKYHEMEYYGDNSAMLALSVADEISEILSDEPEVLAVVKGWIDLESSKGPESTLDSLSHDKYWYNDIPATVIVLRDKGEA